MKDIVKTKLGSIELLRFIFASTIMLFHIGIFINENSILFIPIKRSYIMVDFFFIISGYFLYSNIDKNKSYREFLIKKIIRLFPLFFLCSFIANQDGILYYLLFLNNLGLISLKYHLVSWFVSCLFYASLFYFFLIKNLKTDVLCFLTSILVYLSYLIVLNSYDYATGSSVNIFNYINVGVLRSIGGIGLGILLKILFDSFPIKIEKNNFKYYIFSIIEITFLISFIAFVFCGKKIENDLGILIIFSFIFYFLINNKTFFSNLINKDIFNKLGRYSYSIYLVQAPFLKFILDKKEHFKSLFGSDILIIILTIFGIILGILAYYFIEQPLYILLNKTIANENK